MRTPYGEIPEDDIAALDFRLGWYLRYGNLPTATRRDTATAKVDYGFQYERFVGHLFEEHGFAVRYHGIRHGVEDGGIDLIARAPRKIRLIQCKRWRQPVSADVISRLQGAVERFRWEERQGKPAVSRTSICGVLATSGPVEASALALARHLGLYVMASLPYRPYPAIKAQRIIPDAGRFLLPGTAAYDRMVITPAHGDRFFATVREALANAFYYPPYHQDILASIYRKRAKN